MRFSCEIFVEIDVIRAVENQVPFFISENSVILSPGENGILSKEYFRTVKNKNGMFLFSMKYEFAVVINYESDKLVKGFDLFELKNKTKIKEISFKENLGISELEKFEALINILIDMKLFKEKICVSILDENEKVYSSFVSEKKEKLQYRSFFCFYNIHNDKIINSDGNFDLNVEIEKEFDSYKIKRINI